MRCAPERPVGSRTTAATPWHRRLLAVLVSATMLLFGAPAAAASAQPDQPGPYRLEPTRFGSERHQLIQMFRIRHPDVSQDRNVAAFFYEDAAATWAVVVASIGRFRNNATSTPIVTLRRAPDANAWEVVEEEEWTVAERPDLRGSHAEKIAYLYLREAQVAQLVDRGISEDIPCQSGANMCRRNLANRTWFTSITSMHYLYENDEQGQAQRAKDFKDWNEHGKGLGPFMRLFDPLGEVPVQGPAATLNGAAGTDPGGIDFTTVELRYLADPAPGSGQGIRFAFHAEEDTGGDRDEDGDQLATIRASDAFFVWLSLPRSTFWVNLHPLEPDRIVDPKLGTTDVGRILLEADLQMKRTVGELIHPDTAIGAQFWDSVDSSNSCLSFRQWIVPAPATIREDHGELYILDAPLAVKMESEYVAPVPEATVTADACGPSDSDAAAHEEELFRGPVLPELERAINLAPEYAELRQVYLSRVAAEWYRQRSLDTETTFEPLIDSGNVSLWPAIQDWSPREVFDEYVESFTNGEFRVEREVRQGDTIYTYLYVYGGVDFAAVPYGGVDAAQFQEDWPGLPDSVSQSFSEVTTDPNGKIWSGAVSHPTIPDDWAADAESTSPARRMAILIVVAGGVIVLGMVVAIVFAIRSGRPRHPAAG